MAAGQFTFGRARQARLASTHVSRWAEVKIHALLVAIITLLYSIESPASALILGGFLCFSTYLYLGLREARKAPLWLSPLSFFFFWYSVGTGLAALYAGLTISEGEWLSFGAGQIPPEDVVKGYIIFLVGAVALHAGMQLFRPLDPVKEAQASEADLDRGLLGWLILIWALGLYVQWSPEIINPLGAPGKMLLKASLASLAAFALTPRSRFRISTLVFIAILAIGTVGNFVGNLMSGSKAFLMFSFLPMVWLFLKERRLRRWLPLFCAALMIFYFFVIAPVVTLSRRLPGAKDLNAASRIIRGYEVWMREGEPPSEETFNDQFDQFLKRQFDPAAVGFIVGEVRSSGFLLGDTMQYAMYAFIPRIVWPEKPTVSRGAWFGVYAGVNVNEEDATTALGMSAAGEFYWNFGIYGVIIGMFLIGCAEGGLWAMAGSNPSGKPLRMLLYVIVIVSMPDMPEAISVFASVAVSFLTFKTAFLALGALKKRAKTRAYVPITS